MLERSIHPLLPQAAILKQKEQRAAQRGVTVAELDQLERYEDDAARLRSIEAYGYDPEDPYRNGTAEL